MLHVNVASRHTDHRERGDGYQYRINTGAPSAGIVERRDQEHDAQGSHCDSLEDTQGTGLEAELVLGVKGVRQERNTGAKAGEIGQTMIS